MSLYVGAHNAGTQAESEKILMHSYSIVHAMVSALHSWEEIPALGLVEPRTGLDTVVAVIFRYETCTSTTCIVFASTTRVQVYVVIKKDRFIKYENRMSGIKFH